MAVVRKAWRPAADDPLDAALVDRVRAILALGGVPHAELQDGVQQVRLKLLESRAKGREAPGPPPPGARWWPRTSPWTGTGSAAAWERLDERLTALRPWDTEQPGVEEARLLTLSVAEGLEALPLPQRQVLVLRFFADLPVAEIAEALEVPEGTVKSRLHAAVRALRARLHMDEVV